MKYHIIGADGRTYGPVSLEQLRQWVAERRADHRSLVYLEGAADWTYLGRLPEFASAGAPATPPPIGAVRPAVAARGTNGFAVTGLVCSLLSWICCCCLPLNLLGLIFSIIALVQINSQDQPKEGRGLAIAGLILSIASLLFAMGAVFLNLLLNPGAFNPGALNWQSGSF